MLPATWAGVSSDAPDGRVVLPFILARQSGGCGAGPSSVTLSCAPAPRHSHHARDPSRSEAISGPRCSGGQETRVCHQRVGMALGALELPGTHAAGIALRNSRVGQTEIAHG